MIVALSGRALAASARRAGDRVVVIDRFGDDDTRAYADHVIVLPGDGAGGLDPAALIEAAARLVGTIDQVVIGTGFEHAPGRIADLLNALGPPARLIGNDAERISAVKQPDTLAALCRSLNIPHPDLAWTKPRDRASFVSKRPGAAGGWHVLPGDHPAAEESSRYWQHRIEGAALSVLFVANGRHAVVLGLAQPWIDPTPDAPFRHGGVAGPFDPGDGLRAHVVSMCQGLTAKVGLCGLNGIDCLIDADGRAWLIEVNPRPTAAMAVFEDDAAPLWAVHSAAAGGNLPQHIQIPAVARAAAIVYAPCDITVPVKFAWPDQASDRAPAGSVVGPGEPICTINATAQTIRAAQGATRRSAGRLLAALTQAHDREGDQA